MIVERHWAPTQTSWSFVSNRIWRKCMGILKTAKLGDLKGFTLDDVNSSVIRSSAHATKSFAKESKYLRCWQFVCLLFLCPFSFSPLNVAQMLQPIHYRLLQPLRRMFFCQQQWGKSVYRAHRISLQAWPLLQTVEHSDRKVIRHDGTIDT